MVRHAGLAITAAAALLAWSAALMAGEITVRGEGTVSAVPDMAVVSVGVRAEDESATVAMDAVRERMTAVFAVLQEAGIAERDMQTGTIGLAPRHDRDSGEVTGYRASNTLELRLRDLDALGGVLDAVVAQGANELRGLRFDIDDDAPLLAEARRRAVADAMARAQLYADAAGVRLGKVEEILESDISGGPRPMMRAEMAADSGTPVAPGEINVTAALQMTFGIDD